VVGKLYSSAGQQGRRRGRKCLLQKQSVDVITEKREVEEAGPTSEEDKAKIQSCSEMNGCRSDGEEGLEQTQTARRVLQGNIFKQGDSASVE
jgi:hypothetical protein